VRNAQLKIIDPGSKQGRERPLPSLLAERDFIRGGPQPPLPQRPGVPQEEEEEEAVTGGSRAEVARGAVTRRGLPPPRGRVSGCRARSRSPPRPPPPR